MDFLDDVLDATGRTPREFGAVHVFVEDVRCDASGRAQVTVWLQAAFAPCRGAVLFDDRPFEFPDLSIGQVVRGVLTVDLKAGTAAIDVTADAPLDDASTRIRTPWKLLDTFAVTHEQQVDRSLSVGSALLLNAVSIPLGAVIIPTQLGPVADETSIRVHKARELGALRCTVNEIPTPLPPAVAAWDVKWTPGQPLPTPHEGPVVSVTSAEPIPEVDPTTSAINASLWPLAKRLLLQGSSKRDVEAHLVSQCGLTRADARALLHDVPEDSALADDPDGDDTSSESGLNLGSLLGVGMIMLGALALLIFRGALPLVLGLVAVTMGAVRLITSFGSWRERPAIDPASLLELDPGIPGTRCGRHPKLASLGVCPRCGTWSCRACAPDPDYPARPCQACARSKPFREERLRQTERATRRAVIALGALLFATSASLFLAHALTSVSLGFLCLVALITVAQGLTRNVWVAVAMLPAATATTAMLCADLSDTGSGALALVLVLLVMTGLAAVLTLASTQRGQQKALLGAVN